MTGLHFMQKFLAKLSQYSYFLTTYLDTLNSCCPTKRVMNKKHCLVKPWITCGMLRSIKTKSAYYKKSLNNPLFKPIFRQYSNKLTQLLRISKTNYYKNQFEINKNNAKKIWQNINSIIGKTQKTYEFSMNANILNNFFADIGKFKPNKVDIDHVTNDIYVPNVVAKSLFLAPTNAEEIISIVKSLNRSAATGFDSISMGVVLSSIHEIANVLSDICNLSFQTGIFPNLMKIARVTPIFKSEDSNNLANYRAVSDLPVFSKIFEKTIHQRLFSFCVNNSIIYKRQYGFIPKLNTTLATVDAINYVINSLDNGNYTIGLFLDIQKAFDSIDHKILLDKLYAYGIRGVCNKLFESYLSNRLQYTTSNNLKSSYASIKQGIPQGSILGPLLFTLYINDLPSIFNPAHVVFYADDSSIFFSHKDLMTLVQIINDKLFNLGKWLYYNRLHLNVNKCHYFLFHSRKPVVNFNIMFGQTVLERINSTKFLCLYVDDCLSWNVHTAYLCRKLSRSVGIISLLRHYVNQEILLSIYYALFVSH